MQAGRLIRRYLPAVLCGEMRLLRRTEEPTFVASVDHMIPMSLRSERSVVVSEVPARASVARPLFAFALSVTAALLLGVLTAYAQGWLPDEFRSLANSAGAWALVAFLLALLSPGASIAAASGAASLGALLLGYVVGSAAQHATSATSVVAFWGLAALVAGPLLGLSAHWVRSRAPALSGLGVGVIAGVLIGEGVYGLTYIADTTYPPYWVVEAVVGVAFLVAFAIRRPRRMKDTAISVLSMVATAALFLGVFGQDLIGR